MIDIRSAIASEQFVKFVKYDGANRFFTVCVKKTGKPDIFLTRIRNLEHFKTELIKCD